MPCYHPIQIKSQSIYDYSEVYKTFKYGYPRFRSRERAEGYPDTITVPCGRCIGCLKRNATDWVTRIVNECSLHVDNCILHLTYDYSHLPADGSVKLRDLQLFFKRLRKRLGNVRIRYFACGEYGDKKQRPHYHVIIFGWKPSDLQLEDTSAKGNCLYSSKFIASVWGNGRVRVGDVTVQTAGYVARYSLKKRFEQPVDGKSPEFHTMSRRPGIGFGYYEQYRKNAIQDKIPINHDGRIINAPVPRFYMEILRQREPLVYDLIKFKRFQNQKQYSKDELLLQEKHAWEQLKGSTRKFINTKNYASWSKEPKRRYCLRRFNLLPAQIAKLQTASYFYSIAGCGKVPDLDTYECLDPIDKKIIQMEVDNYGRNSQKSYATSIRSNSSC